MIAIAIVLCLFLSSGLCAVDTCHPTNAVKDLTKITGRWYGYKSTPGFMGINTTCTLLDLNCTSSDKCDIKLYDFKNNETYNGSHTLEMNSKGIHLDKKIEIQLAWSNTSLVVIADCGQKNETMAVYTIEETVSENESTGINTYIDSLKYKGINMTVVDNTVCSAVTFTAPVFLLLSVVLYAIL